MTEARAAGKTIRRQTDEQDDTDFLYQEEVPVEYRWSSIAESENDAEV